MFSSLTLRLFWSEGLLSIAKRFCQWCAKETNQLRVSESLIKSLWKPKKSVVDFKSSVNKSLDQANFIAERSKTKKMLETSVNFFYEMLKKKTQKRSHAKSWQPKYHKKQSLPSFCFSNVKLMLGCWELMNSKNDIAPAHF